MTRLRKFFCICCLLCFFMRNAKWIAFWLSFFFSFIFISWRLIISQHFSGFCHTLTWISHGVICIPHPDPPSPLPLHPIPLGVPSAPGPSTCLMLSFFFSSFAGIERILRWVLVFFVFFLICSFVELHWTEFSNVKPTLYSYDNPTW